MICFYVSGHGFGHASRVQAVLRELLDSTDLSLAVCTSASPRVFDGWSGPRCQVRQVTLDPGVVQRDSFDHDLPATLRAWEAFLAGQRGWIEAEAAWLKGTRCAAVVSDVSPFPLAAAHVAGIPALAMGNFTWDWILQGYLSQEPRFNNIIKKIQNIYRQADLYLRLPMSHRTELFERQLELPLVARQPCRPVDEVRRALGLSDQRRVVLISFGGFGVNRLNLEPLAGAPELCCVWDRSDSEPPQLVSAAGSGLEYPDLIRAADLVLTKPGYSIIAESIAAGTPLAYCPRRGFRESAMLERYIRRQWPGLELDHATLADGRWVEPVRRFLMTDETQRSGPATDGAVAVVRAILAVLG